MTFTEFLKNFKLENKEKYNIKRKKVLTKLGFCSNIYVRDNKIKRKHGTVNVIYSKADIGQDIQMNFNLFGC